MIRLRGGIMTTIESHLSTAELEGCYETAGDPIAKSHFHALWLLSKGYDVDEVAELLSFSTRWVYQLVKRYNAGGPDCLGDQRAHNGTEPTIVTPQAVAALKERIKTPPDDGGQWSGPKVARWLATFNTLKSVHDQRGWGCARRDWVFDPEAAAAPSGDGQQRGSKQT
jgi:transposase